MPASSTIIGGLKKGNFIIYEITGKLLQYGAFENFGPIDLSTLLSGIYLLEISNEEEKIARKIVKK